MYKKGLSHWAAFFVYNLSVKTGPIPQAFCNFSG